MHHFIMCGLFFKEERISPVLIWEFDQIMFLFWPLPWIIVFFGRGLWDSWIVSFLPGGESAKKKWSIMPAFTQVKSDLPCSYLFIPTTASRIWSPLFISLRRAERVWGKWEVVTSGKLGIVGWRTWHQASFWTLSFGNKTPWKILSMGFCSLVNILIHHTVGYRVPPLCQAL